MTILQERLKKSANLIVKQLLRESAPDEIAQAYAIVYDELESVADFVQENLAKTGSNRVGELFVLRSDSVKATARWDGGKKLTVLAGSEAVIEDGDSIDSVNKNRRREMIEDKVFEKTEDGRKYRLTEDVKFNKPSPAASVLLGGPRDGNSYWIHKNSGLKFGAWVEQYGG